MWKWGDLERLLQETKTHISFPHSRHVLKYRGLWDPHVLSEFQAGWVLIQEKKKQQGSFSNEDWVAEHQEGTPSVTSVNTETEADKPDQQQCFPVLKPKHTARFSAVADERLASWNNRGQSEIAAIVSRCQSVFLSSVEKHLSSYSEESLLFSLFRVMTMNGAVLQKNHRLNDTQKWFVQLYIFCSNTIGLCKDHGKIYVIIHWIFSTSGCNRIIESVSWTWKLDQCDSWRNHSKWLTHSKKHWFF